MSNPNGTRRAIAEIRWDRDPQAVVWVGNRPVHSCWPLISAYFRDVLLPPHRRAEEESVTWTWAEPANPLALTRSELVSVRRQLENAIQLFQDNVSRESGGNLHPVDPEQLGAALRAWVLQVVARPDAEFARYLCRTDQGLRLHSWGAAKASEVRFSDAKGLELAGHVLVGGMPALHDVLLETSDGEMLAETPTDSLGAFRFPKLTPGKYRLRARSKRGTFPPHGLVVVLNQASVNDLVLADDGPAAAPARGRRSTRSGSRRTLSIAALIAIVGGGGAWLVFDRKVNSNTPTVVGQRDIAPGFTSAPSPTADARATAKAREPSTPLVSPLEKTVGPVTSKSPTLSTTPAATLPVQDHVTPRLGNRREDSLPGIAADGPTRDAVAIAFPSGGASAHLNPSGSAAVSPASTSGLAVSTPSAGATIPPVSAQVSAPALGTSSAGTGAAIAPTGAGGGVPPAAKSQPALADGPSKHPADPAVATRDAASLAGTVTARLDPSATPGPSAAATAATSLADATRGSSNMDAGKAAGSAAGSVAPTASDSARRDSQSETSASSVSSVPIPSSSAADDSSLKPMVNASPLAFRVSSARLTRTVRVRLSPWRVRLMEDSILPTQPLRAGQVEPVAALRQQILAEQKAKLPSTLTQSEVLSGLRVQIPPGDLTEGLAWRDEQGGVLAGSRVEKGLAEITWAAANAPVDRPVRLRSRNGVVLAEARYEPQTRELVVRTAEEAQAWLRWVVRAVPGDVSRSPAGSAADGTGRFAWRTGTGNPAPAGWQATDATDATADHRVDLPLGSVLGAVAVQSCALFDRVSGWALVTEIRQAADRPLGL